MEPSRREEILAAYREHSKQFAETARLRQRVGGVTFASALTPARALTDREHEVLALVAEGYTSKVIGAKLYVTEETIKSHVANLLGYLGARNRAHAVAIACRWGLLVPSGVR